MVSRTGQYRDIAAGVTAVIALPVRQVHAVQALEDFNGQAPARAAAVAVLARSEQAAGDGPCCVAGLLRERGQRPAQRKPLRGPPDQFAGGALAVQEVAYVV